MTRTLMTWRGPDEKPEVPSGERAAVRVEGKCQDDDGRWHSGIFDAWYLNDFPLHYEDGCGDCPEDDECERIQERCGGCPTTGFHTVVDHDEYTAGLFLSCRVDRWRPAP